MPRSLRVSVLLAAAVAGTIAVAPSATADPRPGGCDKSAGCARPGLAQNPLSPEFSAQLPKGWTNEAQFARPGVNPFGAGPKPPVLALD